MFKLKVIDDEVAGVFRADTEHMLGGYDMMQARAFAHLFPTGECPWLYRDLVYGMADAHGWDVEVRIVTREDSIARSDHR